MQFRALRADEIDCRIATVTATGCSLLLYKDARCDMNILDETVGALNWKREHSRDNANCTVSLWDDTKQQWVSKEDTGTESFTEKEKGIASDSFKRACFNWGIGRELYTAPFIWIPSSKCTIEKKQNGNGYTCKDRFSVKSIGYDDKKCINTLVICKGKNVVYKIGESNFEEDDLKPEDDVDQKATPAQVNTIKKLCEKHKVPFDGLMAVNIITETTMTGIQAANLINSFKQKYGDD